MTQKALIEQYRLPAKAVLDFARSQANSLWISLSRVQELPMSPQWVVELSHRIEDNERVETFTNRFCRLQDYVSAKLIPIFLELAGEGRERFLDRIEHSTRLGWIDDAEQFINVRINRNTFVHEYIRDEKLYLDILREAMAHSSILFGVVDRIEKFAQEIKL